MLTPTEGARFLFERAGADDRGADYRVQVFVADATYAGTARMGVDGAVAVAIAGAPAELATIAEMFAKLTARSAAKQIEDGMPPWPARITRWRGPGRGK